MIFHYIKNCKRLLASFSVLLLVSACSSSDISGGTEVHTHLTHLPPASTVTTTPTGKQFVNDQGVSIVLTSAWLTLSEMELRTDCGASPFARLRDTVLGLIVPVANAHTESTPTKLGTPLVVNLLNPDSEELEFGHFSPAPGNYCGITVHMHPADADARSLPSTFSMIGLVLHLEGSYDNGSGATAFTVDITLEPEHADIAFPAIISLSEGNLNDEIHLNIEYQTWFETFDATLFAALVAGDPSAVSRLLDNVTASIGHD
ncbi:MAG: hypothetical protein JSW45_05915 [Thiotrichales bacterium]|nr:MAG: hypothetical protein JSW45_05915 [Thiotrichales bacterium]